MNGNNDHSIFARIKRIVLGGARNPFDRNVFHSISLVAFFAWVGLGADGLSSSCYGPAEAFEALAFTTPDGTVLHFPYLAIFVAIASALTVLIISASYTQVIEQFPTGGGGYLVASKLLSPSMGMVSGCALLMDYVLTITISIASGADQFFSFLPAAWQPYKLPAAIMALLFMCLLNLRGVKESVGPLVPIFLAFVVTHAIIVGTTLFQKVTNLPEVATHTLQEVSTAYSTPGIGLMGMLLIMLKAYSMGAGTFTGIEAVSNGMPILREPRVETGRRTMRYMAISLSIAVVGLMLAYLLYEVKPQAGKTLNAVLVMEFTQTWPAPWSGVFIFLTLASATALLFVAAQAGFIGGPRVLVNMALDRWFPHKFATFSDRLVTQNGVLLMSAAALATMIFTGGSVKFLVVLYSINVFITFTLTQAGMVKHWLNERQRGKRWQKGMSINGIGLLLCGSILIAVTIIKFHDGGWITLFVTGGLAGIVILIRRHYQHTQKLLRRLDGLVRAAESEPAKNMTAPAYDPQGKTAVLLVNGFNGLGLHTLLNVLRLFPNIFRNFVFVHVGVIDAGNFKGVEEIDNLKKHVETEVQRYIQFVGKQGFHGQAFTSIGTDVVAEVDELAPRILEQHPNAIFFGGQLAFPQETFFTRLLHNNTVFSIQRRFNTQGIPMIILPVRV